MAVGASGIFIISIIVAFGIKAGNGSIDWGAIGWAWTTNGGNAINLDDNHAVYGTYGIHCKCPNGEVYQVSSMKTDTYPIDNCVVFGCDGGITQGDCMKQAGQWSHASVKCYDGNSTGTALVNIASHLPQIVMAFTFQFNFFSFFKSLEISPGENADRKMKAITFRALVSVCSIYLIVATLGYITFGVNVQGKVIENINNNIDDFGAVFVSIINVAFMLLSGLSFPMLFFNCRNFIMSVAMDVYFCVKKKKTRDSMA